MTIKIRAAAQTHAGMVRKQNEDAYLADDDLGLYAVADGVGGHADGAIAARMAIDTARAYLIQHAGELDRARNAPPALARTEGAALVERAIQEACRAIQQVGARDADKRGMRTTLTCMLRLQSSAIVGHVGDSRLYLIRRGDIHRLTDDHTLAAWQVRAGMISPAEAAESPYRGTLTRALGSHESVQVDTLFVEIADGDVLLLCSDGLHRHVTDEELRTRVQASNIATAPSELISLANSRGGRDNITAVALACMRGESAADDTSIDARIRAVAGLPLFQHLDYREHVAVLSVATTRRVPAGTVLAEEGAAASDLYVIVSGRVSVARRGRPLTELGAGAHFGEMALVNDAPRSATVVALDQMDLLVIGRTEMMGLMRVDPVLAVKILWTLVQSLSSRLRVTNAELDVAEAPPDTVHAPFQHGQ
ncbi:MAG: cyclic nucleotide-binding domain-containing protein [Polyangiaceae bacterium]